MPAQQAKIQSEAVAVGELLRARVSYRVPAYQRDYAWTEEEVDALWGDLTEAMAADESQYFLGVIVLASHTLPLTLEIIDGQQRLATVSMIFSQIAAAWKSNGDEERSREVVSDYLFSQDRRTREPLPRLFLNETNDGLFRQVVLERDLPVSGRKQLQPSNKKLLDAFERLEKHLQEWLAGQPDRAEALVELEEFLAGQVQVIRVHVDDAVDAFTLFETLNDRGLELAVSDLFKNYLFSLAQGNLERFRIVWAEIALLVGADRVTQFLRHYWTAERGLVRERELYGQLRESVRGKAGARKFIEGLREAADLYSALSNPEHAYWTELDPETRENVEALSLFGVSLYRPVALAAMQRFERKEVQKTFRDLVVLSFRSSQVASVGAGYLEKSYARAALRIQKGELTTARQLVGALRETNIDDVRFKADFVRRRFKAQTARYVLAAIENARRPQSELEVSWRSTSVTLEHVLPRNPSQEWSTVVKGLSVEEHERLSECIGNLTLLEKGRNRGVASAGFSTKKQKALALSALSLNQDICSELTWSRDAIERRSAQLAEEAARLWRIGG